MSDDFYRRLMNIVEQWRAEAEAERGELYGTIDQLGTLLRGVAEAIKGPPSELGSRSFHDLPELVREIVNERDGLRDLVRELRTVRGHDLPLSIAHRIRSALGEDS